MTDTKPDAAEALREAHHSCPCFWGHKPEPHTTCDCGCKRYGVQSGDVPPRDWLDCVWPGHAAINRAVRAAVLSTQEATAVVAGNVRDGYTASVYTCSAEPSERSTTMIRDADGPWVLNSDAAKAIRAMPEPDWLPKEDA